MSDFNTDLGPGLSPGLGEAPAPAPAVPTNPELEGAVFRTQNSLGSVIQYMSRGSYTAQPGYNPIDDLKGWESQDYLRTHGSTFLGSQSPQETLAIKAEIDQGQKDRAAIAASGWAGTITGLRIGLVDPTMFLPMGNAVRLARQATVAGRAADLGLSVGKMALMQSTAQEALLQATQPERTLSEGAVNVGASTLLAALVGGGGYALLAREGMLDKGLASLNEGRVKLSEHNGVMEKAPAPDPAATGPAGNIADAVPGLPPEAAPAGTGQAMAAGAAATDTRDLSPVPYGLDSIPGVGKVVSKLFPNLDVLTNSVHPAKAAISEMVDTPIALMANKEGQTATRHGGPTIERELKQQREGLHFLADQEMLKQWGSYLEQGEGGATLAQRMTGRAPEGKLSFDDFNAAVYDALSTGDQHPTAQVAAMAQWIRKNGLDPIKDRALASIEGFKETTTRPGETYVPRNWDKDKISANWNDYVGTWTDHLAGEQSRKAQSQERIGAYHGALESHRSTIDKLERQIDTRSSALDDIEARQEEVRRFNQFAFNRSAQLSEPLDALRGQIRRVEDRIAPHLDRLEELRDQIRQQKDLFPEIRDADRWVRRLGEASQRMRGARDTVAAVDAAGHYVDELDAVITEFRGEIRAASHRARDLRVDLGAGELVALEEARSDINGVIVPQQKQLRRLRKELREERAARIQKAQGGAVFETQIRQRGNTLADRASGKDAEITSLEDKLAQEIQNHDSMREKIETEIAAWDGKTAQEAKSALKARAEAEKARELQKQAGTYKGKDERLSAADKAVDSAVRRILESERDLSRQELQARAEEIASRVIGTPEGRLPYDASMSGEAIPGQGADLRGHAAHREIDIPYEMAKPWLRRSATEALKSYTHSVLPDALLAERFDGDPNLTVVMKEIESAYAAKRAEAKTEAAQNKLKSQMDADIKNVSAMRDRIRGTFAYDPTMAGLARFSQNALKVNNIISSHGMAIASLPDFAGVVFRHGIESAFADAWLPFSRSLMDNEAWAAVKAAGDEWKAFGIGIEMHSASRNHALSDIAEHYRPNSKFERALTWASDKAFIVNLLSPLTDIQKRMATNAVASNILRAAEAVAGGKATAKQIQRLAEGNITEAQAARIWEQWSNNGGERVKGIILPNMDKWTDQAAAKVFRGAVGRDVDIAVVQPGMGEVPKFMSKPGFNVLVQYKKFTVSATQRVLISNLQRHDAGTMAGLVTAIGLGMLAYRINALGSGQKTHDRAQDWIKEGVSRGGILGVIDDSNSIVSKATGGKADMYRAIGADKPLSKYVSRDAASMFLGPTYGKLTNMMQVTRGATHPSEWNESDSHALRMMTLGTNFPYLPQLFDKVEQGANHALGIPMKAKP